MNRDLNKLSNDIESCKDILIALGDETRLHILVEMIRSGADKESCDGIRVGDICKISNLSRPAVSHHMKYLKDAGIIKVYERGTKNYYYLDTKDTKLTLLVEVLKEALEVNKKQSLKKGNK